MSEVSDRGQLIAALMNVPCQHNDWRRDGSTVYELVPVGRHEVNRWSAQVQSAGQWHEHNSAQREALAEYIKCASPEVVKSLFAEIERLTAELALIRADRDVIAEQQRVTAETNTNLMCELAQYREAPVVAWQVRGGRLYEDLAFDRLAFANATVANRKDESSIVELIARPEPKEPT